MIKGTVPQEDITIINVYASNNKASKCMKQKWTELEGEIENSNERCQ